MSTVYGPQFVSTELRDKVEAIKDSIARRYESTTDDRPWIVAFSGGKDSTLVAHLVYEAVSRVRPSRRKRPIHVLSSDTLVETPAISKFVQAQIEALDAGARAASLPVHAHLVKPELHETFWVRLIGYGYPAPNRTFRWCTERLKIRPTNLFIQNQVKLAGEVLILLGSRLSESSTRARSIRKHETSGSAINPHNTLKNAYVWSPVRDLTTEEVWEYLALTSPPWGGSHRELQNLYKEANSGECAIVLDETTKPCGNSRFGCWTCTVVERDKSIEGFIGSGRTQYEGMARLRDKLASMRDDPATYRERTRRNGREGNGPLRMKYREEVLKQVLDLQRDLGEELISAEEVQLIHQVWLSDKMGLFADEESDSVDDEDLAGVINE